VLLSVSAVFRLSRACPSCRVLVVVVAGCRAPAVVLRFKVVCCLCVRRFLLASLLVHVPLCAAFVPGPRGSVAAPVEARPVGASSWPALLMSVMVPACLRSCGTG